VPAISELGEIIAVKVLDNTRNCGYNVSMLHNTSQLADPTFSNTLGHISSGPGPGMLPTLHCGSPLRSTTSCKVSAKRPDPTSIALKHILLLLLAYAYMLPQTLASS
jgi:hypothetical protein